MSIKDKAKKLNFSGLPAFVASNENPVVQSTEPSAAKPKTAPGAMMAFANEQRSELLKEVESLRKKGGESEKLQMKLDEATNDLRAWEGAKASRHIDPTKIRRSKWANRHGASYLNSDFETLKTEIQNAGGNVQPIKVRKINDPKYEYEIVFGHRRHQACLELELRVFALIENLGDVDLFVEMDRENRARKDLSPWEQGVMYRSALRAGLFPSNRKLAEAVGVDLGNLGKVLKLADLPDAVIQAFPSPLDLQFKWSKSLNDALVANKEGVLAKAKKLNAASHRLTSAEVFERLISNDERGGVVRYNPPDAVSVNLGGRRVGSLQMNAKGGVSVAIESGTLSIDKLESLASAIEEFLKTIAED